MTTPLPKQYHHQETEKRWQKHWASAEVYTWDESKSRAENFVIDTPPPTVSGILHMGHIYSYTQADYVARFQRMHGKNVFYPMGFDDNGLPTERLVEKVKKIRAHQMSREDFIQECESVSEEARKEFRRLFESVALSVDWSQEYHTISAESRQISQLSFLDLYEKERVYRQLQPMLWDPVDQTAIAQAEVEDKERESHWNNITFRVEATAESITIGTTRPELLPACVAVFYHPEDARYQHLQGQQALTPLCNVKVPILADESVQPDKGTGLVMCCTFGDETDIHWWKTHDLPARIILDAYGKLRLSEKSWLSDAAKSTLTSLEGLKIAAAREAIVPLLEEAGLLQTREPITHAVKCAERSGAPLEILPTQQWFIKILDQKAALKQRAAECNWHPQWMQTRMDQWIDGLSWDWCISRQRYFGVPFPVWYLSPVDKVDGNYINRSDTEQILCADPSQLPVNPLVDIPGGYEVIDNGPQNIRYVQDQSGQIFQLRPEIDVMDTWATSSVSPQLSSRGISSAHTLDPDRHATLFPADLRPQAHEIIRTWAFYTVVKAHLHEQTIPWKNLMVSGWCLAEDKQKMSKSKGNVVTPVDLIEEHGADVVRYWSSTSRLGADTAFSRDVLKIGKKLINKLWNASKFAAIHLDKVAQPHTAQKDCEAQIISYSADLWILSRLHHAIAKATESFQQFEYCVARIAVEDFFWNDFCDNYLEIVKARVYDPEGQNPAGQRSAAHTIYHCLEAVLRLFAPILPHITEELYSHIFPEQHQVYGSIHGQGTWPNAALYPINQGAENAGHAAVAILNEVRKAKAEANVSLKWPVEALTLLATPDTTTLPQDMLEDLKSVTQSQAIHLKEATHKPSATNDADWTVEVQLATAPAETA